MRVLVTGGCGFLGSHVCRFFSEKGWDVLAYDNLTKFEINRTGYRVEAVRSCQLELLRKHGVRHVLADVESLDQLLDHSEGCDYVIHTAAQPAITIGLEIPARDCSTNVIGTLNVLECARKRKIPVASTATIHVYGNGINHSLSETETRYVSREAQFSEDTPLLTGRLTPLHVSKAAGDAYVRAYVDSYDLRAASFRMTGLYGPGQFGGEDHGWLANFVIRAVLDREINIYGSGKQVRDMLFASDAARVYWDFFNNQAPGVYNVGAGADRTVSLLEAVQMIGNELGMKPKIRFHDDRPGDLRYFAVNSERARTLLGWRCETDPRSGIAMLSSWVKDNIHCFR